MIKKSLGRFDKDIPNAETAQTTVKRLQMCIWRRFGKIPGFHGIT